MSFDEDLVYAIMQGNISILESFDLNENMINQRVFFFFYKLYLDFFHSKNSMS